MGKKRRTSFVDVLNVFFEVTYLASNSFPLLCTEIGKKGRKYLREAITYGNTVSIFWGFIYELVIW